MQKLKAGILSEAKSIKIKAIDPSRPQKKKQRLSSRRSTMAVTADWVESWM